LVSAFLVDSNVLIDVATLDPSWSDWSFARLDEASDTGPLVINPIIYGEVSVSFSSIAEVDARLPPNIFRREDIPFEAAFLAGKAFATYRKRGGDRTSLLPDFLIGAHAAVRGYSVLTRDSRRYATYFPRVRLITPTALS
jgi:predicted nucleic acid-binding protein